MEGEEEEGMPVLLCCVGRSGSTLLQTMVNRAIPGASMCGENAGAIAHLMRYYRALKSSQAMNGEHYATQEAMLAAGQKPAWFNFFDLEEMRGHIRATVRAMLRPAGATVWGCKEIRFDHGELDLLEEFRELFPATRVIIHIRMDIHAQAQSGWFRGKSNAAQYLRAYNAHMVAFALARPDWCFLSTFEGLFQPVTVNKLFAFLGHPAIDLAIIQQTIQQTRKH